MNSHTSMPVKLDTILVQRLHDIKLKQALRYGRREEKVYE